MESPEKFKFDEDKYINGITGKYQSDEDSPTLIFNVLMRKDGSGVDVQIGNMDRSVMFIPVFISTISLVEIALDTIGKYTEEVRKGKKDEKGMAM